MKRKIITTKDGSKTIHIEDWNEQYHSIHGAIQEANHVFIKHGLLFYNSKIALDSNTPDINILEIGFGTGLNTFLTYLKCKKMSIPVKYTGVEAYPVNSDEISQLNYADLIEPSDNEIYKSLHSSSWEKAKKIASDFILEKLQMKFEEITFRNRFDIVYFDAFGARVQPELWTEAIFKKMYDALKTKGVLVTYSAKGSVRRAMQAVGFDVERLPGPPGKREMLRGLK